MLFWTQKQGGGESLENPIFKKFPPAAGLKTFIFRRFRTCLNALKFVFCMLARRRRKIFTIYALNMLEKPCFSCICALKILKIFRPAAGEIRGDPYLVSGSRDSPPLVILDPKTRGGETLENPIFKKNPPAAGLKNPIFERFRDVQKNVFDFLLRFFQCQTNSN